MPGFLPYNKQIIVLSD